MEKEKEEEIDEIELSTPALLIVICIISICIGMVLGVFFTDKQEYRTPEEIAVHLEEMLFNYSHLEDIQQHQLRALITSDLTTIGDFKRWYRRYNTAGLSRSFLETQVNIICYDKKWNWTN